MNPAKRWAESLGIDISDRASWSVELTLLTTGALPTVVLASKRETYFHLSVSNELWCVDLGIDGRRYFTSTWIGQPPVLRADLDVPAPPALDAIGPWLASVETLHGIAFRRDRPLVRSTVKGGKRATETWLSAL